MKFILFTILITAAFCAPAKKCMPTKFESDIVGKVGITGPNPGVITLIGNGATDNIRGLSVSIQQLTYNSQKTGEWKFNQTVYQDFNASISYTYRPDLKACFKTPIPKLGNLVYCQGDKRIKVIESFVVDGKIADVVEFDIPSLTVTTTLFRDSMVPISTVSVQTVNNVTSMTSVQYGNFKIGISDESIFNLPDQCK